MENYMFNLVIEKASWEPSNFIFLILIAMFVFWMLSRVVSFFHEMVNTKAEKFTHFTLLEVVWVLVLACILLIIAVLFFAPPLDIFRGLLQPRAVFCDGGDVEVTKRVFWGFIFVILGLIILVWVGVKKVLEELKKESFGRVLVLLIIGWFFTYSGVKAIYSEDVSLLMLFLSFVVLVIPQSIFSGIEKGLLNSEYFHKLIKMGMEVETCVFAINWFGFYFGSICGVLLTLSLMQVIPQILSYFYLLCYLCIIIYYRARTVLFTLDNLSALENNIADPDLRIVKGESVVSFIQSRTSKDVKVRGFSNERFLLGRMPQFVKGQKRNFGTIMDFLLKASPKRILTLFTGGVASGFATYVGVQRESRSAQYNMELRTRLYAEEERLKGLLKNPDLRLEEKSRVEQSLLRLKDVDGQMFLWDQPVLRVLGPIKGRSRVEEACKVDIDISLSLSRRAQEQSRIAAEQSRIAAEQSRIAAEQSRIAEMQQKRYDAEMDEAYAYNKTWLSQVTGVRRPYPEMPAKSIESVIRGKQDLIEHKTKMLGVLNEVRGPDATSAQRESFWEMIWQYIF